MSGVGKGVATASIGKVLQSRGFVVTAIKIDPYVNVDAGTMNPTEHGEVFVLDEGTECDQDMGNYERFLDVDLPAINYMTTGSVYESVIHRERNMGYGGKCVEVVPHIPLEVIDRIDKAAKKAKADFITIEIGGTVGEYQNILFLEAARMLRLKKSDDVLFVLVSFLPLMDPLKKNIEVSADLYFVFKLVFILFMGGLYFLTIYAGLGHKINVGRYVLWGVAVLFFFLGLMLLAMLC